MANGPSPRTRYPIQDYNKLIFLKHFIQAKNILVGDYTYFDDRKNGPEHFEEYNVLYNYHPSKVKLVIRKFCAIAAETKFVMTGDHKLDGFSTYPFPVFKNGWDNVYDIANVPVKGDILIGNDVWFGYDSLIKNGVIIGSGSIIAAGAVIVKDVPPYTIVAGNPGRVVKKRFSDEIIEKLLDIARWDWPVKEITRHLPLITDARIEELEKASKKIGEQK